MLFKKLYFQILLRVTLILLNALLLAYIFFLNKYVATQINLLLLLIAQSILLVYYLNKTNRDLAHFFSSVKSDDYSIIFNDDYSNKSYQKLYDNLNQVNKLIEQTKIEKIGHYEYLKQVVDNVGIGILSFDENLKIEFFNPSGKDLLKMNALNSLSDLDLLYPGLSNKIKKLQANTQQLVEVNNELELSVKTAAFKIKDTNIKLIAFQNIQSELDKKEVESWQKIIRVLTHEIMNSVSPIDSSTNSIYSLFQHNDKRINPEDVNEDIINKTVKGMKIIQQRSKGMLNFVRKFRDLTLLPEPTKEIIKIQHLYQQVNTLFFNEYSNNHIHISFSCVPEDLSIHADKSMIEQVLINLVKNALEATENKENAKIEIRSGRINNHICIQIKDNGKGIPNEIMENIFVPFFTTKKNLPDGKSGGSGIGLSLSRQIMHLHGGNIFVKSEPDKETVFTLQF